MLCSCFVFLRLVCPMFSVSLECSFSFAPSVLSNVYLRDNYILVIPILQNEQYFYTAFNPTLHPFNHISYHFNFIVHKMLYKIVTYTSILKIWGNIVLGLTEGFTKLSAFHAVIFVWCFTLFFFVLRTLWCQFLWIVHFWLPLWYFLTLILDKYYQIWYI